VHGKLLAQEERCRLLEKQLEQTRLMVQSAERDRTDAVRKIAQFKNEHDVGGNERRVHASKIAGLEQEHLRLMASQALAAVCLSL
jgi:hypothetical protein